MSLTPVDAGRVAIAKILRAQDFGLAVGTGLEAWGATPPAVQASDAALAAPYAMARPVAMSYAEPDNDGLIVVADGTHWTATATPTGHLYLRFVLDYGDDAAETLREIGLYLGPTYDAGVGGGQSFVPWADVTAPGDLWAIERFPPRERAGVRLEIEKIINV